METRGYTYNQDDEDFLRNFKIAYGLSNGASSFLYNNQRKCNISTSLKQNTVDTEDKQKIIFENIVRKNN